MCTILDEVMAWALVDHDIWGVTARMSVEFKRPVPIGRPIRAEGRVGRGPAAHRRCRGRGARRRRRRRCSPAPTATFVARARGAQGRAQGALRRSALESDDAATPDAVDHPASAPSRRDAARRTVSRWPTARPSRRDAARPRPRRGAQAATPSPSAARRASWSTTRPTLVATLRAGLRAPGGPRVPRGHAAWSRPASGPSSASASRCSPRSAAGSARPSATTGRPRVLDVADRPPPRGDSLELHWLAYDLLERTIARRAGAHLAARPRRGRAARASGSPSTRSPTSPAHRHPRGAVPLGGAGAARLLAVALGAPPRRLDDRDAARTSDRGAGREPGDRRPAALPILARPDRRRRARRPEGARRGRCAR